MASQASRIINKLFVGNIPWTVGHRELVEYFSQFGHVNVAKVVFDRSSGLSRGYGFVEFSARNGYDNATNKGNHTLEGHSLSLQPASS